MAQESCSDLTTSPPIEYNLGVPTEATAKRLLDQIDYQRAIQMYLWGLPAVGTRQYRLANAKAMGGGSDDWKVGYLGSLLKASLRRRESTQLITYRAPANRVPGPNR
jgi:hypothetical protein